MWEISYRKIFLKCNLILYLFYSFFSILSNHNVFFHIYRKIPEVANGEDKSGTTAICVLISENYTIFSNCGDSRGVLSAEGSKPVLVTQVDFSFFKLLSNIEQYYYVLVLPI